MLQRQNQYPSQAGSVSVLMVLFLPFLLGVMALSFNAGRLAIVKTQLQTAVDACAVAAGKELDGSSNQFAFAKVAGLAASLANNANFPAVAVSPTITFDTALTGSFTETGNPAPANAANYKFVKCSAAASVNKVMSMMGISTADNASVAAYAGLVPSSGACALPVAVCNTALAVQTSPTTKLIQSQLSAGGSNTGDMRWTCYGSGNCSSAKIQGLLNSDNTCNIDLTNQIVTPFTGATSAPYADYNTRFGIRTPSSTGAPDFTGFEYRPALNSYSTYTSNYSNYVTKRAAYAPYQSSLTGSYSFNSPTANNSKSRRIGLVPVINCATSSTTITSRAQWACVLMLNPIFTGSVQNRTLSLEYLGNGSASACSQLALAGGIGGPLTSALVK